MKGGTSGTERIGFGEEVNLCTWILDWVWGLGDAENNGNWLKATPNLH